MEQKYYWTVGVIAVFSAFIISGCVQPSTNEEKTFLKFLNEVNLETSYTIEAYTSYASSGGGTRSSETRKIEPIELKETVNEIKSMEIAGSFEIGNRNCYYGGYQPNYFVCFADNKIVNYVKKDGPMYSKWNALGYEFDIGRSTIINSINDLKKCNFDAECTLTSSGVCDPTGKCGTISAACDPGCRTSINAKHYLIWEAVPLVEDQCITDKCAVYEQKEHFEAACVNNICESKIVK